MDGFILLIVGIVLVIIFGAIIRFFLDYPSIKVLLFVGWMIFCWIAAIQGSNNAPDLIVIGFVVSAVISVLGEIDTKQRERKEAQQRRIEYQLGRERFFRDYYNRYR